MATTINAYSVSLGMDASSYINASKLSRSESAALKREIGQARTPLENYELSLNRLDRALKEGAIDQGTYNRLLDAQKQKLNAASEALARKTTATGSADNATAALTGRLKGLVATYISLQTITSSIKLAAQAEQTAVQFEVLTGSVETANALLSESKRIAAASPLSLLGVQQAYQTLLGFGIAASETTKAIGFLSDIAGGNEERFKSLTLAYAQATAAGRLQGQDLLQMINAGFNPLQAIAAKTGETLMQVKDRMSLGAVSAEEMTQAFIDSTSAGGRFNGMTERLSETMGGRLAQAMSKLQEASIELGNSLEPLVTALTDGFEDGNSVLQDAIYIVGKLADGLAFALAITKDFNSARWRMFSGTFDVNDSLFPATDKLLDRLAKRDAERAKTASSELQLTQTQLAAQSAVTKQIQEDAKLRQSLEQMQTIVANQGSFSEDKQADIDAIRSLFDQTSAFGKQASQSFEMMLQNGIDYNQRIGQLLNRDQIMQLQRHRMLREQSQAILEQENAIKKREETERKALERNAQLRRQSAASALQAAKQHFEQERQNQMKRRSDMVSLMSGAGAEVGSAESVAYLANLKNSQIANNAIGKDQGEPTDKQLLEEARKQAVMKQRQEARENRMLQILERQLEVAQQNGFKRIR